MTIPRHLIDKAAQAAADAWKRLNIIAEAYINDGHHVTIARTTYAPIEEDTE